MRRPLQGEAPGLGGAWSAAASFQSEEDEEVFVSLEAVLVWIIVGGIAGLLADRLVKGVSLGIVGAIIVGIVGAFIGGWLFGVLGVSIGGGIIGQIVTAFVGAVLLLLLVSAIRRR